MRRQLLSAVFWLIFATVGPAFAQEAAPKPNPSPGPAGEMLEMWQRIAKMNTDMAEHFPEDKYDYKPAPEVRSFKEQMLHVAGANYFFIRLCGGEKTRASHAGRATKADVVAVLQESYADQEQERQRQNR